MHKLTEISELLFKFLATDQSYYLTQTKNGTYTKTPGQITPPFISSKIANSLSYGVYQKNSNSTVKWICYDFDILKKHIGKPTFSEAEEELKEKVHFFCKVLSDFKVPYLLECSGNRGFHVWLTFIDPIQYQVAYDILDSILVKINLKYDDSLIGIDLFPQSKSPSDGVGKGVKMPLSLHTKSNKYSTLLMNYNSIKTHKRADILASTLLDNQLEILESHSSIAIRDIEKKFDIIIDLYSDEIIFENRIKSITVKSSFDINELFNLWNKYDPLKVLVSDIKSNNLSHDKRILVVGLLLNIKTKNRKNFNKKILHDIFKSIDHYDVYKTSTALEKLSSFNFPTQEQIESITHEQFNDILSIDMLIKICIPRYENYINGSFEFSEYDINATCVAELNYLFQNDEVQSRHLINKFSNFDSTRVLNDVNKLNETKQTLNFYKHTRNEENKTRVLTTLGFNERIFTSLIIKQIDYFLKITPNYNSHGYKFNKGFKGGYIFEPWLYSWIEFINNINSAIDNETYKQYYIVKTDIESFYDNIDHDKIKRILLGDLSPNIKDRLLNLSDIELSKYKNLVHKLIEVTESLDLSGKGVPQGPAYARYIAELYLNTIDIEFDEKIKSGNLFLYQRYVDDIFYVVKTEKIANEIQFNLEKNLELLGLNINNDKTVIKEISNFREDFNVYKSQSKYAVDRVSKNFHDATAEEKEIAVQEFLKLLDSETVDNDLSFIFSHLSGIKMLDDKKKDKVVETLNKKTGRGSLYKNLFTFVLDNPEYWKLLSEVKSFDELQSEVLTSTLINMIESTKETSFELETLIVQISDKIILTSMVKEHLAYMHVNFNMIIDISEIPATCFINIIVSSHHPEKLFLNSTLLKYINTELNNIKDLPDFIEILYPLCVSNNVSEHDLKGLASTYYAKLSFDDKNGKLSTIKETQIKTQALAQKYYYLLCLFSASTSNHSIDLLSSLWEYCAYIFNNINSVNNTLLMHNWLDKIEYIEIDHIKAEVIISAIVDGNIYRGENDDRGVFEKFHNTIFVYIVMEKKLFNNEESKQIFKNLREISHFYSWIIDNNDVNFFPSNKAWFEQNIIQNNTVMLRKKNKILIRKPINEFIEKDGIIKEHAGFAEKIEDYNPENLVSVKNIFKNLTLSECLNLLIKNLDDLVLFPNIYTEENILHKDSLEPFSIELSESEQLILQMSDDQVVFLPNNLENYIDCFFQVMLKGEHSTDFKRINEKYIQNLDKNINLLEFLKEIALELNKFDGLSNNFYYDIAIASALYNSINETNIIKKINKFILSYHKYNPEVIDRHIYAVHISKSFNDDNPIKLLESISISLGIIPTEIIPSLSLYLSTDINKIIQDMYKLENIIKENNPTLELSDFKRIDPKVMTINREIIVNRINISFDDIQILNMGTMEVEILEDKHTVFITSAEHFYFLNNESSIFILVFSNSISNMYSSIVKRFANITEHEPQSYPPKIPEKFELSTLRQYNQAITRISIHQNIIENKAKEVLDTWLSALPENFRQPLVLLIDSHVGMSKDKIKSFLNIFHKLIEEKGTMNPFLIKDQIDNNGTHRVIFNESKYGKNTRSINELTPYYIADGAEQATIIVDNIITGSQIISAIKHYVGLGTDEASYFQYDTDESAIIVNKLKNLKVLNICTILYTTVGFDHIQDECLTLLNKEIKVEIVSGYNIGKDAFFGTTSRIGKSDKDAIRSLITNKYEMKHLYNHLNHSSSSSNKIKNLTDEIVNDTDLIARYKSLPKKCFSFLQFDLKRVKDCRPFIRVLENNE